MFGSATTIYRFSITHRIHMFLFRLVLLYFKCFEVPTTKISDISASFLILPHISKTFGPISTKPYFFDQIYRQQHEIINLLAIWCSIRDVLIVCVIWAQKLNHFISIRINFSLKSRWRWQPQSQCWHIRQRMCECVFHLYFESLDIDTQVNAFNAFFNKKNNK